jgi:hypothetical protein
MNAIDYSQPPQNPPPYLKYLLGLPNDATQKELSNEWTNQVVPLMAVGPQHLFDREAMQMMGGGISGISARRIFKLTDRGAMLSNSAEREAKARQRAASAVPPFLKQTKKNLTK